MRSSLRTLLCCSALCVGLVASNANASESRIVSFLIPCNGQAQIVTFTATGLGTASTRFIQGAEVALFEFPAQMQYLTVVATSAPNAVLLTMGTKDSHVARDFTGFFSVPNNAGSINFSISGACAGSGEMQGIVTIDFFS